MAKVPVASSPLQVQVLAVPEEEEEMSERKSKRRTMLVVVAAIVLFAVFLFTTTTSNEQQKEQHQPQHHGQYLQRRRQRRRVGERYHPDKSDVDCERYWHDRNMTTTYSNNNNHSRRSRSLYTFAGLEEEEYYPCREQQYNNDNQQLEEDQQDQQHQEQEEEHPPNESDNKEDDWKMPDNIVSINISVAIDRYKFWNGIPVRLTQAVKKYLNHTNVTSLFAQEEYQDGRHFQISVYQPPQKKYNETRTRTRRDLQQHAESNTSTNLNETATTTEQLWLTAISSLHGNHVGDAPNTTFSWYSHVVYLLVHQEESVVNTTTNNTTTMTAQPVHDVQLMEWLQVELQEVVYDDIRLQGPLGPYYDTNNHHPTDNAGQKQISFLEWSLQSYGIPVAGVAIPGNETLDELQDEYHVDFYHDQDDMEYMDHEPPPPMAEITFGGGAYAEDESMPEESGPHVMDDDEEFGMKLDEEEDEAAAAARDAEPQRPFVYHQPLSLERPWTTRQWCGLATLLATLFCTTILVIVANEVAKKRAQEELWGNDHLFDQAREDIDYLNVGWRFASQNDQMNMNANASPNSQQQDPPMMIPDNYMMMEVFDKRGLGYRMGSSLLMGGYEYKSTTQWRESQQQQQPQSNRYYYNASVTGGAGNNRASGGRPQSSSYRVDPSVTPFG